MTIYIRERSVYVGRNTYIPIVLLGMWNLQIGYPNTIYTRQGLTYDEYDRLLMDNYPDELTRELLIRGILQQTGAQPALISDFIPEIKLESYT